ncbi:hypothetical protein LSTR_LSTR016771 [Laodelphax striatellus]|uniref:Uncharacterized protein n=1 Tax=Laodelphax striatellus TaxID=195883 RepID=A0A482WRK8_LAOST|nr:hypothetical protein LSTR_LSTR016771 [Laodelphax striatellus]
MLTSGRKSEARRWQAKWNRRPRRQKAGGSNKGWRRTRQSHRRRPPRRSQHWWKSDRGWRHRAATQVSFGWVLKAINIIFYQAYRIT